MADIAVSALSTPKRFDGGPGAEGRVGLIVLADDPVAESEVAASFAGSDVSLHVTRMPTPADYGHDTLRTMQPAVADAVDRLLPADRLSTIALCCSALAASVGRKELADLVAARRPGVGFTDPGQASIAVMRALGTRTVGLLLTPRDPFVNQAAANYYASQGFAVTRALSLGLAGDLEMSTLSIDTIGDALAEVASADADTILVPCTAMRTWLAADRVDPSIGRRILTGNRALALHAQSLASGRPLPEILAGRHR